MSKLFRVLVLIVHVLVASSAARADVTRPNVLFIAIDDLNDWAAGLSDYSHARTPNIDRLAKRGVLFSNAHCGHQPAIPHEPA